MTTHYVLTSAAEQNLADILDYTIENFGIDKAISYSNKLEECFYKLALRNAVNVRTLNMKSKIECLKCSHHYVFATWSNKNEMIILAVFHERMDLMQRLSNRL